MNKLSFNQLGQYGALGNQLWQIAGTIGISESFESHPAFPSQWFYKRYFSIPDSYFVDSFESCIDIGEEYLQNFWHWDFIRDRIRSYFQPSEEMEEMLNDCYGNSLQSFTAVHVRRGNNVEPQYASHHPVCELEYFEKAMSMTSGPFIVFTDSIEWCRNQSIFAGCEYGVGPPSGIDVMTLTDATPIGTVEAAMDLHAIARCKNVIISNSTFSWWGAWLHGPRLNGNKVIYPSRWFGEPLKQIDTSVMFNSNWAKEWIKL